MALSPTQRMLAALHDEGWECEIVEKWITRARVQSTGQDYAGH